MDKLIDRLFAAFLLTCLAVIWLMVAGGLWLLWKGDL